MDKLTSFNGISEHGAIKKTKWSRPEGKFAIIVATGLLGAFLYGLYKALPFLVSLAANTLTLILMCTAIAAIVYIITSKSFRNVIGNAYYILMRKILSFFIELDPVAILEKRIDNMREKIIAISETMGCLKGSLKENQQEIDKNEREITDSIRRREYYESNGKESLAHLEANQIVRLTEYGKGLRDYQAQSEKWYEILSKMEEMAKVTVVDTQRDIDMKKKQFESVRKQHKAYSNVMSILKGDEADFLQYTQAMEYMAQDINNKLGEMEHVLTSTNGMLEQYDMNKLLNNEKAKEIISRYDKYGIEGLFTTTETNTEKILDGRMKSSDITKVLKESKEALNIKAN